MATSLATSTAMPSTSGRGLCARRHSQQPHICHSTRHLNLMQHGRTLDRVVAHAQFDDVPPPPSPPPGMSTDPQAVQSKVSASISIVAFRLLVAISPALWRCHPPVQAQLVGMEAASKWLLQLQWTQATLEKPLQSSSVGPLEHTPAEQLPALCSSGTYQGSVLAATGQPAKCPVAVVGCVSSRPSTAAANLAVPLSPVYQPIDSLLQPGPPG